MAAPGSRTFAAVDVNVSLARMPTAPVTVTFDVPRGWRNRSLADIFPTQLNFAPALWFANQTLTVTPTQLVAAGDYYIQVSER